METINLFGASGHALVIKEIIESVGKAVGCMYDDNPKSGHLVNIPVYKAENKNIVGPMIISVGSNPARKRISERIVTEYSTAIHSSSIVSPSAKIEKGSVVMPGAMIEACSEIGKHCIINTGAIIDHECKLSDFVHISPGATLCGGVKIGEGSWIGAGAVVIQGINIGKWCIIGAGAVVLNDIPDYSIAFGNPCKIKGTNMQNIDNQQLMGGG